MPDTQNENLTAAEFRKKYGDEPQPDLDGLGAPADEFSEAVAIDPGSETGLAWTDGDRIRTVTTDFWTLATRHWHSAYPFSKSDVDSDTCCVLLEAPYMSRPGMSADEGAIAYRSGQVAREAELLRDRLDAFGYTVIEHDPSQQGKKWTRRWADAIVGDWDGPNNEHCRDALRLLFFYDFL
jgi:hypothetical protein